MHISVGYGLGNPRDRTSEKVHSLVNCSFALRIKESMGRLGISARHGAKHARDRVSGGFSTSVDTHHLT